MGGTYWSDESSTFEYDDLGARMAYFNVFRLILCSTSFGVMIVVAIAFFHFSKGQQRKTKLFRLQATCVMLAIIYNASSAGNVLYRLKTLTYLSSQNMNYRFYCAWRSAGTFAGHGIPTLSDGALLFRISSFYPSPIYSKKTRFLIFLPFWFLLVSRTILTFLLTAILLVQWLSGLTFYAYDAMLLWDPPQWSYNGYSATTTLELSMGILYCIGASSLLLFKAYSLARTRISINNRKRVRARMQFFAEATLMCCIPPIFLNVAAPVQLIGFTRYAYYLETETLLVNTSVIFSILGTSWSNIRADWLSNRKTTISTNENFDQNTKVKDEGKPQRKNFIQEDIV